MSKLSHRQKWHNSRIRPGYFCEICNEPLLWIRTTPYCIKRGWGRFCSTKCRHDWRRAQTPKFRPGYLCEICENPLLWEQTFPALIAKGSGRFCSTSCMGQWQSTYRVGENVYNWQGINAVCDYCKILFPTNQSRIIKQKNLFCSRLCYARWQSENKTGKNNYHWQGGKIKSVCAFCNSNFFALRCHFEQKRSKFCSRVCKSHWQSKNKTGEQNPSWKGGKSFEPYPPTFNAQFKQRIRHRDGYICALCSKSARCVHHINYVKDDTTPENCVTLCRSCHGGTGANREYWQVVLTKIMNIKNEELQCKSG